MKIEEYVIKNKDLFTKKQHKALLRAIYFCNKYNSQNKNRYYFRMQMIKSFEIFTKLEKS